MIENGLGLLKFSLPLGRWTQACASARRSSAVALTWSRNTRRTRSSAYARTVRALRRVPDGSTTRQGSAQQAVARRGNGFSCCVGDGFSKLAGWEVLSPWTRIRRSTAARDSEVYGRLGDPPGSSAGRGDAVGATRMGRDTAAGATSRPLKSRGPRRVRPLDETPVVPRNVHAAARSSTPRRGRDRPRNMTALRAPPRPRRSRPAPCDNS